MIEKLIEEGGVLLEFGLILLTGYLLGSVANLLKLPRVSGYIVAGILMSPSVLGIIDKEFLKHSDLVTHASLSVITFLIGSSLSFGKVRRLGKAILLITLGEAELAFLFVSLAMFLYLYLTSSADIGMLVALALLFGALASPTDPTATLAVIHEYRAKGVLTTSVLGVAALDDATGIINFVIGFSIALSLTTGHELQLSEAFLSILLQIGGALVLGAVMGFLMYFLGEFAKERKEIVTLTIGVLFLTFALAKVLGVDELLSTMSVGIIIANFGNAWEKFERPLEDYIEDLIFTAFFVVGSAFLDLSILLSSLPVVLLYVLARFSGKFTGSFLGAHLSGAPPQVKRHLAFALFPQGGIVIGLALLAYQNPNFREVGTLLVNVVIGATVIHELMGPVFSKFALQRAGEISS